MAMGWYRDLLVRVGQTRWGSWSIQHVVSRIDRVLYRLSGGRLLATGAMIFPTLLLTTTGRKSGRAITLPLLYLRDGERLIIGTGNTGPGGSQWPANLAANPEARVQIGRQMTRCRARRATP